VENVKADVQKRKGSAFVPAGEDISAWSGVELLLETCVSRLGWTEILGRGLKHQRTSRNSTGGYVNCRLLNSTRTGDNGDSDVGKLKKLLNKSNIRTRKLVGHERQIVCHYGGGGKIGVS